MTEEQITQDLVHKALIVVGALVPAVIVAWGLDHISAPPLLTMMAALYASMAFHDDWAEVGAFALFFGPIMAAIIYIF